MPEISEQEFQELQRLRNEQVTVQLNGARATFLAEHPWVPRPLIDAYQGGPNEFGDFGKALLDQFPQPQPPAPSPSGPAASPTPAPPVSQPPEPPPAQVTPPNPAASAMHQNPQPAAVNNNPPPAAQQPPPNTQPVPVPGSSAQVDAPSAEAHRMQQIREKVLGGRATVEEALQLSQHGFTTAMNQHGARVRAAFGDQR